MVEILNAGLGLGVRGKSFLETSFENFRNPIFFPLENRVFGFNE
jgi:hypothetical protein